MKNPPPKKPTPPRKRLELRGTASVTAADAAQPNQPRRFRMVANTGEPMSIWGFDGPVVVDLATVDTSGLPVPALYDHCAYGTDYIVGLVESASTQGAEFVAEGKFTPTGDPHDHANKVLAKSDAGYQWQVSVGGDPATVEKVPAGQSVQVNGRTYAGPVSIARGLVLREISFVVLGADRRTSAVVSSSKGSKMSFEDFVQSMGFDPAKLDETQAANMKRIHSEAYPEDDAVESEDAPKEEEVSAEDAPAEEPKDEPPTNAGAAPVKVKGKKTATPAHSEAAELRAEKARISAIEAKAAEYKNPTTKINGESVNLCAHAIAQGWTPEKAELEMLRASRVAPAVIVKGNEGREQKIAAMSAGLLMQVGAKVDYKFKRPLGAQALLAKVAPWLCAGANDAGRDKIMNAGVKYAGYSALDLCREALRLDGGDPAGMDYEDVIRAAISPRSVGLKAASSGSALTHIFSTSVHAQLLMSYEQSPDTTQGWVSEAEVANFQSQERSRIDIGGGLKPLPRGKKAEDANYSDSQETYKIARYAKGFTVDEQDMLDDNLGGLSTVPSEMGMAAARLRPDLVYSIILDNPTLNATSRDLFNTTDGNLVSTGGALTAATLRDGVADMALFRENSVNLNLRATHLLVGPDNELLAWELTQSPQILYGGDDEAVRGNLNAIKQLGLTPVSEARLQNGVTDPRDGTSHSGDANAWYLVCANAHTIEVGYRRGTGRAPKVRSKVLDEGRFGMHWDVSMDIGAAPLDWKGMYKNEGGS